MSVNESVVEDAALSWFGELGYDFGHGPDLAPGEPAAARQTFGDVVLVERLREAILRLNAAVPEESREDALRKVLRVGALSLIQTNRAFHRMLRDGVDVEYKRPDGSIAGDKVRLVDFGDMLANDWLAVNQFTVIEGQHNRRPDIVVFVNGLPLALIELKNAADENATIWTAYAQLQTYKAQVPSLLHYNAVLVVSDGLQARMGSLTANQEWFKVWRTIDGEGDAPKTMLELEVMIRGVFDRQRFLDLLQHFIVFEEGPDTGAIHKIIAGYHQYHAVNLAVEETLRASGMNQTGVKRRKQASRIRDGQPGDRRAGVVWHTQGSGKSYSMLFYAARMVRHLGMQNPTVVVLTDRNDLDEQLLGQFQRCADILGQTPVQATSGASSSEIRVGWIRSSCETAGHTRRWPMEKKYVVRLNDAERGQLQQIVKKLSGSSQKVRRAQILLKADSDGPGRTRASLKRLVVGQKQLRTSARDWWNWALPRRSKRNSGLNRPARNA